MGAVQSCFKRYEKKYLLTRTQYEAMRDGMREHMTPDAYGCYAIGNIYYDTPDYRLIRASLEKPVYKEKLRMRSYGVPGSRDTVFVEIKKKFNGVVYKRRITMEMQDAALYLYGARRGDGSQISREIDYFLRFYGELVPSVYLSYDRTAYFSRESADLRVTFDRHIAWRREGLRLTSPVGGREILDRDLSLMEVKAVCILNPMTNRPNQPLLRTTGSFLRL